MYFDWHLGQLGKRYEVEWEKEILKGVLSNVEGGREGIGKNELRNRQW